jgi:glyoxylase-like metal-dependent hydrolase (beta-lactamase superfamily II)
MMRYLLKIIVAILAAAALITGCATSPDAGKSGNIEVWWLGQSAMRITTPGGKVIMVDPWITTNPKTPAQYKTLDALGKIDLILVTHAHGDHLGDAVALAKKNNVPVWGPAGLNQQLQTLGELTARLPRSRASALRRHMPSTALRCYGQILPPKSRKRWPPASRSDSSSNSKTASGFITWATRRCSGI